MGLSFVGFRGRDWGTATDHDPSITGERGGFVASSQGLASRSRARSWRGGGTRQQSCAGPSSAGTATASSLGSQGAHTEAFKLRYLATHS